MKKISPQEQVSLIMDNFDFEKVHKTMVKLDWWWASENTVPSLKRIKEVAKDLLSDLIKDTKLSGCSTGGLYVTRDKFNCFELSFRITDFSCGDFFNNVEYD